jgi:hypothetical protein
MINKNLILKTLDLVDKIKVGSIIEITKDDETNKFQLRDESEYTYNGFELVCITEEDAIWNDYDSLDDIKAELICDAVKNFLQDINILQ